MKKIICITGASSGFGEAIAKRFSQTGWSCIITGRRKDRLQKLAAELSPAPVLPLVFDVRDKNEVAKQLGKLPEDFSAVSVLVNNAGLALGIHPAYEASLDDWEQMVDTNIKGLLYTTHAILPGMVARKNGHIVNIGSIAAHSPYPGSNVYGGTKAFVWQFSRGLRSDLHGTGVRVSNIEPGLAESEFSLVRFKGDKHKADNLYIGANPLRPEDVAETVFWTVNAPQHVNVNNIEVMPTSQSWAALQVVKATL